MTETAEDTHQYSHHGAISAIVSLQGNVYLVLARAFHLLDLYLVGFQISSTVSWIILAED